MVGPQVPAVAGGPRSRQRRCWRWAAATGACWPISGGVDSRTRRASTSRPSRSRSPERAACRPTSADLFDFLANQSTSRFAAILAVDVLEHFSRDELLRLAPLLLRRAAARRPAAHPDRQRRRPVPGQVIYGDLTHMTIFTPAVAWPAPAACRLRRPGVLRNRPDAHPPARQARRGAVGRGQSRWPTPSDTSKPASARRSGRRISLALAFKR